MLSTRAILGVPMFAVAGAFAAAAHAQQHLLITEVVLNPPGAQFIEIHNPTAGAIALDNYYLSDNAAYSRLPCCQQVQMSNDFTARFPPGSSIPAGGVRVIAVNADTYIAAFGSAPNFELVPSKPSNPAAADMFSAWAGSIGFSSSIPAAGEWITLFFYDQLGDRVSDVDIIRVANPDAGNGFTNKNVFCLDGPDPDLVCTNYLNDALTMPAMSLGAAPAGFSHKRRFLEARREQACSGNGIAGHDETTENTRVTWDGTAPNVYTAPTPGVVPALVNAPGECFGDANQSGAVDVDDLITVILGWGPCPGANPCTSACIGDIAPLGCRNCTVDVDDLIGVILTWGTCP